MSAEDCRLIEPVEMMREAYLNYLEEFRRAGEDAVPGGGPLRSADREDFATLLQRERDCAAGANLPAGNVPASTYWLIGGGRVIGTCNLRHRLNDRLRQNGGHVGYSVRPSERNKGYATAILKSALQKARAMGIDRALITCDKENLASSRVIQKCGGVLEGEGLDPQSGTVMQRYWIDLGNRQS